MEYDQADLLFLREMVFWESRNEYYKIIDLFVNDKINFKDFADQIFNLEGSNSKSFHLRLSEMEKKDSLVQKFNSMNNFHHLILTKVSFLELMEGSSAKET